MKRLIVLVLCLCSVSSFSIFSVPDPALFKNYEASTEDAKAETVVYTNVPTSSSVPEDVAITISDSTSSILSGSVTAPTDLDAVTVSEALLNLKDSTSTSDLSSLSNSTTDSTDLQESVTVRSSTIANFGTESLPESATETATILSNPDTTSTSIEQSYSAIQSESANASTSLSPSAANFTSSTESAEPSRTLTETVAYSSSLSKTEKASTNLSDSASVSESAKTSTSLPDLSSSSNPATTSPDVTVTSIEPDSETDAYSLLEVTTEDLSFLSLELLPPKTEYRKNEPDPRYDY